MRDGAIGRSVRRVVSNATPSQNVIRVAYLTVPDKFNLGDNEMRFPSGSRLALIFARGLAQESAGRRTCFLSRFIRTFVRCRVMPTMFAKSCWLSRGTSLPPLRADRFKDEST
jgi:hypothetical protein